MARNIRITRSLAIVRLQRQLERKSYPRLQMGFIVALTGAAGWLCSFLLLHTGIHSMALRYPLALGGAYVAFLFLLWVWLRTSASDYADLTDPTDLKPRDSGGPLVWRRISASDYADLPDLMPRDSGNTLPSMASGGGGDFGGGGASGSFGGATLKEAVEDAPSTPEVLSAVGDAAGSSFDADELAIPLIAIALAVGLALASLYVVYLAPALFAELLFDGVLSYTLYRRLRTADSQHWLGTAFRRTVLPFGLTAVFLMAVGAALGAFAPGAHSLSEALHYQAPNEP